MGSVFHLMKMSEEIDHLSAAEGFSMCAATTKCCICDTVVAGAAAEVANNMLQGNTNIVTIKEHRDDTPPENGTMLHST